VVPEIKIVEYNFTGDSVEKWANDEFGGF